MNAPIITAVAAWVPAAIPLSRLTEIESAMRAIEDSGWGAWMRSWHPDYGHWLEAWPDEDPGDSRLRNPDLAPPDKTRMVPVETGTDLSGLAAKVAKAICARRTQDVRPVNVIMFCHSTPDEDVPTTVAGRLCAEIGPPCFPFSVSQQHGVSPFTALRLATDLFVAEPDVHTILIVAAEKWRPPFSRICGSAIVHGDAAGALLVERTDHGTGGLRLLDVAARHVHFDTGRHASTFHDANTFTLLSMMEFLLVRHGLHHSKIDDVIGPPGMPSLTAAVSNLLAQPGAGVQSEPCVHFGAADSIVRLAQWLTRATCCRTYRLLLWGFGLGGFAGTALLETSGAPLRRQLDVARTVS
ncbi:MAG: 3-oxoacyl-ACP synthase [Paraburkholderia tropica]|uniref:3-oxoacyl-ACP synthase n=1 Tax=Paraburkholderia tropica TaxID=92647 RepID=UPI0031017560